MRTVQRSLLGQRSMSLRLVAKSVLKNPGNRGKLVRRALRAAAWQVRKRLIRTPKTITLANSVRFRAYPDCVVSSGLVYADYPEFEEISFLRAHLQRDGIVVDVGANVGHVAMLLSDIVGAANIHAFEPTPVTFRRLVDNWQLNSWPTQTLYNEAVGDRVGTIFIDDTADPTTTNQVEQQERKGAVQVPLVTLDSCRTRWATNSIALLKIDVEGFEPQVFGGAEQFLASDRPKLIMFESLSGTVEPRIAGVLGRTNYRVFQLDCRGRLDLVRCSNQNLFAVPSERADELQQARR